MVGVVYILVSRVVALAAPACVNLYYILLRYYCASYSQDTHMIVAVVAQLDNLACFRDAKNHWATTMDGQTDRLSVFFIVSD